MVYNLEYNLGFIHIPKTGGMSIRKALKQLPGTFDSPLDHFHKFGRDIKREVLGDCFDSIRWFAVSRNPVDLIWSSWKWIRKQKVEESYPPKFRSYVQRCQAFKTFPDYVYKIWIGDNDFQISRGGFWYTYCTDHGESLNVRKLNFCDLSRDWDRMINDWQLPEMELPRINTTDQVKPDVSDRLRSDILQYCWLDW